MTNKIILKKSAVASKVPTISDLDYGELALNYADGKLYYKNSNNAIDEFISSSASVSGVSSVGGATGAISAQQLLDFIKQVDGTGSGLDADTLDGINSSSFVTLDGTQTLTNKTLSSAVLTGTLTAGGTVGTAGQVLQSTGTGVQWSSVAAGGVTSVNGETGNITASQLLDAIKTVDGTGSGLDADTLDGINSSSFATLDGAQTLTNKTIAAGSNTISGLTNSNLSGSAGITNANLANSSLTIGTTSIALGSSSTTLVGLTSVTSTSFVGALTGNASTATKLATARAIQGVNFDGSAPITVVTAGTGITVTGTAVAVNSTIATKSYVDIAISEASNTDEITEGIANLYFTTARARSSVSAGTGISYNSTTGVISTSAIPNASLTNSKVTVGTTDISLGSSSTTLVGLTSVTSTSFVGALTGNASTATTLQTARTINGVSFDGSANIIVADDTKLPLAGGTMSGAIDMGSNKITGLGAPIASTDAATKQYVDEVAEGLKTKPAVELATTANLSAAYDNGTSGVGATLTSTSNGAFPTIDGVTLTSTTFGQNGVLVKNQTNAAHNGRYNLTQLGDAGTPWILTKCGLCDEADEIPGAYVFVKSGTLYAATGWVQTVASPSTFVVGTDAITVTQFSGAGSYTAGTGLSLNGTQFSNTGVLSVNSLTGDITATNLLDAIKTVDGSGSGLDAELLDGQTSSHYLDYTNLTNKPTIPTVPTNVSAFTNDANYATETFVNTATSNKQDTLVSATNIKTINGQSLLGSGDIVISGGTGGGLYTNTASLTTTAANQTVDSFDKTQYRTVKYLIQAISGSDVHATEVTLMHNDANTFITEYAIMHTSSTPLITVDANIDSTNVYLTVTPLYAETTIDLTRISIISRVLTAPTGISGDLMTQSGSEDLQTGSGQEDLLL